jgi:hypothetical protein
MSGPFYVGDAALMKRRLVAQGRDPELPVVGRYRGCWFFESKEMRVRRAHEVDNRSGLQALGR